MCYVTPIKYQKAIKLSNKISNNQTSSGPGKQDFVICNFEVQSSS